MKKAKLLGFTLTAMIGLVVLGACGKNENTNTKKSDHTVALITDTGGVDDRSFNQSAWEGMQVWGKEHDLARGNHGFQYFQSGNESDYVPNIDQALNAGFKTIFGIGYKLKPAIKEQASRHHDTNFVIVDEAIEGVDNIVSATFKDNESAYLAGVAAAYSTNTNIVGFVGGVKGTVIERFEAGFKAGVADAAKEQDKEIKVLSQYAGDFAAPDKGRSIASGMYAQNADIIYHAAGGTGNGIFQEAKAINETGSKKVWVIGADRDQTDEGKYMKDGKEETATLTSTLKSVGTAVHDLSQKAYEGHFPGGKHLVYGLKEDGVTLVDGQLSDEAKEAVTVARERIIEGNVKVPEK